MLDSLRDNHTDILAALFAIAVVATAWLEVFRGRRPLEVPRPRRWIANLSLAALNTALFALAVPFGSLAAAIIAEQHGWGALRALALPSWTALLLGILALDLFGYGVHWLLHRVPFLWRLHQVHHSDIDIDFTTTVRHHPAEVLVTILSLCAATIAFGVSPESVVLYQIAATVLDLTSHGNLRVPAGLDHRLRSVIVTPDMHVVHHSALTCETDSNYGTVFSFWDRLFGTYVAAPALGIAGMTIGLDYRREPLDQRLDQVLISPFVELPRVHAAGKPAAVTTD